MLLVSVLADSLDRAAFHGLFALGDFLVVFGLLENVGISLVVRTGEIAWCGFTAKVAVDALAIDVKLSADVFYVLIFFICHSGEWIACPLDATGKDDLQLLIILRVPKATRGGLQWRGAPAPWNHGGEW